MMNELTAIANEINRVAIGASVDMWGVPQLTRVILLDIIEESETILLYDANDSTTIENLQYNPKMSLSITNVKTFNGRQVKGLAEVATSVAPITPIGIKLYGDAIQRGVRHFIKLRVAEIFDVIQKDKSLRQSEWKGKVFAEFDKINVGYAAFAPSELQPIRVNSFKETFNPLLQSLLEKRFPGFIGTVEFRGAPNISPRFIISAEDNFLLWGDRFKNKTFFNFSRPSPVSALALDWDSGNSVEFIGWGKFFFFGKTVALVNDVWRKIGFKDPMQAIHFFPEEIYRTDQNKRRSILKGRSRAEWLPQSSVKKMFNLHISVSASNAETSTTAPNLAPSVALKPKAAMISNEALATHIISSLKQDLNVKLLTIEQYDRAHLSESTCLMATIGNRGTEVDLHYLRALLDAASFYSEANLNRKTVKFIIFIAAFEKSLTHRALINALESYIKTLNQAYPTKIEVAFIALPPDAESDAVQPEIRKKVLFALQTNELGELNYFKAIEVD